MSSRAKATATAGFMFCAALAAASALAFWSQHPSGVTGNVRHSVEPTDGVSAGSVVARTAADGSPADRAMAPERWNTARFHDGHTPLESTDASGAIPARAPIAGQPTGQVLSNEQALLAGEAAGVRIPITVAVLVLPIEFELAETLEYLVHNEDRSRCITTTGRFTGPLHGEIPYPGGSVTDTIDNQTVYYPSTEPEDYERLIFGREGYTVPLRAGDPNVNEGAGVDISGLTVQSYFDAQSDDTVEITGTVAPWVPIQHSEAYFGIDRCVPRISSRALPDEQLGKLSELVVLGSEALKARGGEYATSGFWQRFDRDDDGYVDALWIVHSGRGQEYGGGTQGEAAIWSRASSLSSYGGLREGYTIHDNGTPNTDDDIRIDRFTMLPEDSDIGVFIEEFGHSTFGLPDLYTRSSHNSVGWWAPMSSGIWGGELGGTRPVNMPLWFRMVADCGGDPCGWADPVKVITHTTPGTTVVLGQAGSPAGGSVSGGPLTGEVVHEGLQIELPDQEQGVANLAGDGKGAYSSSGHATQLTLTRRIDLTEVTDPVTVTFDAHWRIPRMWGYVYFEVSTDGEEYQSLPDLDGRFTDFDPMGLNDGFGLTGDGDGELRFDLSAFAGEEVHLRLRCFSYLGIPGTGWWVDDLRVTGSADGGAVPVLEEGFEAGLGDWESEGWLSVPVTLTQPHHYLVEWRNANGFDASLKLAAATSYSDSDEWRVDRVPANVPGALVMYRNLMYPFSGALLEVLDHGPSIGPKYGLLVVDTSFWPVERPSGRTFAGQLQSLDATLALQDQPGYLLEVRDPMTGRLQGTEEMTGSVASRSFDDALGYYPGFRSDGSGEPAAWDQDASVVVPARDGRVYSTRITWPDKTRPHALDGESAGGDHYYGSGNPGDEDAHWGVHVEVVDQADDGSWGALRIHNTRTTRRVYLPSLAVGDSN